MFCILILTSASTPFILGKSRMRKRARTDLCGGRPAMVVPTATTTLTVGEKVRRERRWTSAGAIPARELVRSTR
jgi:hypothetical protein